MDVHNRVVLVVVVGAEAGDTFLAPCALSATDSCRSILSSGGISICYRGNVTEGCIVEYGSISGLS